MTRIRFYGRRFAWLATLGHPLSPPRGGLPCWAHPTLAGMADLHAARLYLCVDSRRRQGDLADFLDAVLAGGVDIVQLREKGLEAREEMRLLEVFAAAAQRHGALWAVNDRADIARAVGAPILHLGQDDLPVPIARDIVGVGVHLGRSTHSAAQADAAKVEPGVAYYCCGPTWTTPTKPGRPAAGPELIEHAAAGQDERPWFAIGGIETLDRLDEVIARGARRAVVVRAITEAEDPGAAAAAFAARLTAADRA
jgi:thiamine-phosphate pyrophosphorylase